MTLLRSSALAGDLRPVTQLAAEMAAETGERSSDDSLDELSQVLLLQYRQRFLSMSEPTNPGMANELPGQVIAAYQGYWRAVLTHTRPLDQADRELQAALGQILNQHSLYAGEDDVFSEVELALGQLGLGSSLGFTAPWRDLYIWTAQHTRNYRVELTDSVEPVTVTFIEQPLVQGWQHYASLDLLTTSGWATEHGLYCLCWSYDLESTAFQVSWLKHEARHSVDLRKFPGLPEVQLEYRAKLTELAFSGPEVPGLLRQFANNAEAGSASAHTAANYRVSRDIYREIFQQEMPQYLDPWQLLGPDRVAPAARKLLQRDTELLQHAAQPAAGF